MHLSLCVVAALVASTPATAAEPVERRWTLSANVFPDAVLAFGPLWSGYGVHNLELERVVAPSWSLYLGGGWVSIDGGSDLIGNWHGPIGFVGARYFPFGKAPSGWWVSLDGFAHGGHRSGALDAFGPGLSTGYRFQGERWSLNVGVGARLGFVSDYGSGMYPLPSVQIAPGFSF